MSARLSALLDELEATLRGVYSSGITFGRSAKDLNANDAPPRIVWTYPLVSHGAPEKLRTPGMSRPTLRALVTRSVQVAAHCWGSDLDGTEQLVHDLIAAAHKAAWGSVEFAGEDWLDEGHADFGTVGVVRFVARIPVMRRALQAVTPTALELDITGAVPGDGVIEGNEP